MESDSPPAPERFAPEPELGIDDPLEALTSALANDDSLLATEAYRRVVAAGALKKLGADEAIQTSHHLERTGNLIDAARLCRHAASIDRENVETPSWLMRGALLLRDRCDRPDAAKSMLVYLVKHHPGHELALEAEALLNPPPPEPIDTSRTRARARCEATTAGAVPDNEQNTAVAPRRASLVEPPSAWRYYWVALLVLTALLFLSWLLRDRYRAVDEIVPAVHNPPVQTPVADGHGIDLTRYGYDFHMTPTFDYEITGFIVSKREYGTFGLSRSDRVIPYDICMIWGWNAFSLVYQAEDLKFSQRGRFCFIQYQKTHIKDDELSNNHLIPASDDVSDVLDGLMAGDQIRMRGKLVNVHAKLSEDSFTLLDAEEFSMKSSTNREDTGGGACEVIYLEEVEVLREGNSAYRWIYRITSWLLGLLILAGMGVVFGPRLRARFAR